MWYSKCALMLAVAAVVGAVRGWTIGNGIKYQLTTIVLSRESRLIKAGGDVGYQFTGELIVAAVWQDPHQLENILLRLEVSIDIIPLNYKQYSYYQFAICIFNLCHSLLGKKNIQHNFILSRIYAELFIIHLNKIIT